MHQFEVKIEPSMMRAAWHAWFFKAVSIWRLGAASLLLISAVMLIGHLTTMSIVLMTLMGLVIVMYVGIYFVGLRSAMAKLASVADGRAGYEFSEATIGLSSSLGSASMAWSTVTEVRRYHDLVLLQFLKTSYNTIPTAQMPPEALAFLIERARSHGATITGF